MTDQRINSCLTFYQGKCPHLTMMAKFYLFPQILNAIDIELAEGNCLDCKQYIDRRVLSTKSALEVETLHQRRTTIAPKIEKRQHGRIAVRLLSSMVTSRSVIGRRNGEYDMASALVGLQYILCQSETQPSVNQGM